MAVLEGVYKDAVGLELIFDLGTYARDGTRTAFDLTGNSALAIEVTKPSGGSIEWVPAVLGAATDGYLTYTTQAGDLDEVGSWDLQPRIEFAGGLKFFGRTDSMQVNQRGT